MPRPLSNDVIDAIKSQLAKKTPFTDIQNRIGVSKSTISKLNKTFYPDATPNKAGRKPIVTESTKSLIRRKVTNGELLTAREVHKEISGLGYKLTAKTAANTLRSMGFSAGIKKKKPFLKQKNQKARLAWAKRHQHWTVEDWKRVIFSDETKINVWGSDGIKYYWARPGEKMKPHHLDLTVKHGNGSLMMWGCMTYSTRVLVTLAKFTMVL